MHSFHPVGWGTHNRVLYLEVKPFTRIVNRVYLNKRHPLSIAVDGSKITNKRRPPINAAPNQNNVAFTPE